MNLLILLQLKILMKTASPRWKWKHLTCIVKLNYGYSETELRNGEYKKIARLEFSEPPTTQATYEQKLTNLNNIPDIEGAYPCYTDVYGNLIGSNNYFLVKLLQVSDTTLLQTVASQKNVSVIRQVSYMPLWYILSANPTTLENSLQLSAYCYETGYFAAAEPAFTGLYTIEPLDEDESTSPDILENCYEEPNWEDQWNLFNNPAYPLADINVCDAWDLGIYGQGVKVAVVDTGIKEGLSDLPFDYPDDVIATSGPFEYGNNYYYGYGGQEEHGTMVASIIGAKHDNNGMGGIAPEANMLYVANELASVYSQIEIAYGINEAVNRNAEVINMSFGNTGTVSVQLLIDAFENALQNGRNGLGTVLIAASGNNPFPPVYQPANYPNVLAVGSTDELGVWGDCSYGPELDIVAPGTHIVVTNFSGVYQASFGTSLAAPHVSGVAALMIAASPDHLIKGEAVRNILKRTAQRNSDPGYDDENFWFSKTGPRNDHLGHGIINAGECVRTARAFETESQKLDLYIRDTETDYGSEPTNATKTANYVLWNSPDIWVRNQIAYSYEHENPAYTGSGSEAYVYVKVINKSNENYTSGDAVLKLYWSKLHNSVSWPDIWDGSTTVNGVVVGGLVPDPEGNTNGISIPALKPGEEQVLLFKWAVPNPDDFEGIFPYNDPGDFSFLARIVSTDDPIDDLSNPDEILERADVWINTLHNNNLAWKNVTVVKTKPVGSLLEGMNISNLSGETKTYSLEFSKAENSIGKAIYEEAEVYIQLDNDLYQGWLSNGSVLQNAIQKEQNFKVTDNNMLIDNISLENGEIRSFLIDFNFLIDEISDKDRFYYHFVQRDKATDDIVSGKTFIIEKAASTAFDADAGEDKEIDKTESTVLSATEIDEPAIYNWYGPEGNLIHTGTDVSISPEITQVYQLEVIKEADAYKDYDEVQVSVNPYVLGSINPNPATAEILINYIAEDAVSAYLIFTEVNSGNTYNHILNTTQTSTTIDMSGYNAGIYFITLACDGSAIDHTTLVKE